MLIAGDRAERQPSINNMDIVLQSIFLIKPTQEFTNYNLPVIEAFDWKKVQCEFIHNRL